MGIVQGARYAVDEIRENGDDRSWWRGRINTRINSPVQRWIRPKSEGVDIPNSDWDALIVIDATRDDLFRERRVKLNEDFDRRTVRSRGSSTREWLDQNFTDEYGDTVYVTGNPQVSKYKPDRFHRVVQVWRDGFDPEELTIPAQAVTDAAIDARERHPDKRLIIHYVQPHEPFVGHPELHFLNLKQVFPSDAKEGDVAGRRSEFEGTVFGAVELGLVTRSEVWDGYLDNLDYVLKEVNRLLPHLDGKVVLTSDHGNAFPRFSWPVPTRVWQHPPGLRHKELIDVPWLETTVSERPTIVDEGVNPITEQDGEALEEKLAHLGYR
jgi:hypothetical protein